MDLPALRTILFWHRTGLACMDGVLTYGQRKVDVSKSTVTAMDFAAEDKHFIEWSVK